MSHDRIVEGEPVRDFVLPEIDGREFHTEDLRGRRYLLSLFRFASCPFCNMRVHELVSRWSEFPPDFGAAARPIRSALPMCCVAHGTATDARTVDVPGRAMHRPASPQSKGREHELR
jgi:hypothetical protein